MLKDIYDSNDSIFLGFSSSHAAHKEDSCSYCKVRSDQRTDNDFLKCILPSQVHQCHGVLWGVSQCGESWGKHLRQFFPNKFDGTAWNLAYNILHQQVSAQTHTFFDKNAYMGHFYFPLLMTNISVMLGRNDSEMVPLER